ncbi:MAG: laccase, partial [Acidimicrobiales bacterium]|nr:laccase [Acidimicrobiales bacterium]
MAGTAHAVFTSTDHGDLAVGLPAEALAARRSQVVDLPWTWLRQVHGARVVTVHAPGDYAGAQADAAVTATPGAALAVHTADCGPIVLRADGVVGVVHAGWRGVAAGVIGAAAEAMRSLGATDIAAEVGPCIRARCYEFGGDDLDAVAAACGDHVRATTAWGTPALDLGGAIHTALAAAGIAPVLDA